MGMTGTEGLRREVGSTESRRRTRHTGRRLFVAVFLLGFAAASYLAGGFVRFARDVALLTTPPEAAQADGIVVLTGGEQRLQQGIELLRSGEGQRLLVSGVNRGTSAKALARTTGTDSALFECCVDLDYEALNTIGNAEMATRWAHRHGFRRLLLVTSDYHIPRSLLEMADVPDAPEVVPYPVSPDKLWRADGWPTRLGLRLLATEYAKVLAVKARVAWHHVVTADGERRVAGHVGSQASFK
ncbi:YdcF family protein [Aureimonas ureilytica]|uniref:YdcF family protein n=1 Tax=Aureimonas ureilytica TaxID=401562 RepID=UPI000A9F71C4|nr:YdcF family protein [Aureimonas ureilytica]